MQSPQPIVEVWQLIGSVSGVVLVVLTAYGTLILQNRNQVNSLHQRLLGAEGDDRDTGFVQDTRERLDDIEESQEQHAQQTHTQLYKLDQKMDVVLDVVVEEHEDIRLPGTIEGMENVPPPPGEFYRGDTRSGGERWTNDGDDD
jgi:hypothetical protein